MVPELFFSPLVVLIALAWLCLLLQWTWPSDLATGPPTPEPLPPVPKRKRERKPFAGLITKPHCDTCEHGTALRPGRVPIFPVRLRAETGVQWPYVSTSPTDPLCRRTATAVSPQHWHDTKRGSALSSAG